METILDRFGRVVIPKKVREDLGLEPGVVLKIKKVDALIVKAAKKSKVERLLTFNINDLKRVWPDGEHIITMP